MIIPGEHAALTLRLLKPMVIEQGIRFTFRDGNVALWTGVAAKSEKERQVLTEGKKVGERAAKAAEAQK